MFRCNPRSHDFFGASFISGLKGYDTGTGKSREPLCLRHFPTYLCICPTDRLFPEGPMLGSVPRIRARLFLYPVLGQTLTRNDKYRVSVLVSNMWKDEDNFVEKYYMGLPWKEQIFSIFYRRKLKLIIFKFRHCKTYDK